MNTSDQSNPTHPAFQFHILPISEKEIDGVSSKCWDSREVQLDILRQQGILGFGAWDTDGRCIAQLHCYRVALPDWMTAFSRITPETVCWTVHSAGPCWRQRKAECRTECRSLSFPAFM